MRHSQLRYGPSRIDDTKIQERRETALRRGTDVNWIKSGAKLLSVEVPTLTASTGMAQGARGSWIDINCHFLGSVWLRGIDISFIDFFLCMIHLGVRVIGVFAYPPLLTDTLYIRGAYYPYHISSHIIGGGKSVA